MRVIHFVGYFPPERLGGVGEFVAGLHHGLRAAGHHSTVVTTGERSAGDVHRIASTPRGWFLKSLLWTREACRHDVVHCQSGEAVLLLLMLSLRRLLMPWAKNPKTLATFHVHYRGMAASFAPYRLGDETFATGIRPLLYRTVVSWAHRLVDAATVQLADAINTISVQSARDVLGRDGEQRAHIIYYGLDELPTSTETADPVELLYAGAGGHRKRVIALAYVLEAVRQHVPDARLRVLGFLPENEPELTQLLREKGLLESVDFAGVKAATELPPFYAAAQVLLVPSAYEGLPFVILEAMRSGLPVVATRVSGHPEAIRDGENGFLVDLDRPEQMADRSIRLLQDAALRDSMAEAARQTIRERFMLERQVSEYLALYRSLSPQAEAEV